MRRIGIFSALVAASSAAIGCGASATTTTTTAPQLAVATPAKVALNPNAASASDPQTAEEILLARIEALGKTDSLRARQPVGVARRPHVTPVSFRMNDLPLARMPEVPHAEDPANAATSQQKIALKPRIPAMDLMVDSYDVHQTIGDRTVTLRVKNPGTGQAAPFGQVVLTDNLVRGRNSGEAVQIYERCGPSYAGNRFVSLRWERFERQGDHVDLTVTNGFFDRTACEAFVGQRVSVSPRPIFPGAPIFGARTCSEDPCDAHTSLMLVFPRASQFASSSLGGDPSEEMGAFGLMTLPLQHGGGGAMTALLGGTEVATWQNELTGTKASQSPVNLVVGIDITQSIRDTEPLAIGYVDLADSKTDETGITERIKVLDELSHAFVR